jgi:hypothetical protein
VVVPVVLRDATNQTLPPYKALKLHSSLNLRASVQRDRVEV